MAIREGMDQAAPEPVILLVFPLDECRVLVNDLCFRAAVEALAAAAPPVGALTVKQSHLAKRLPGVLT